MYVVASETSAVARFRRRGQGDGPRRIARAPGRWAHALTTRGHTLCGLDASSLIRWPDLTFGEMDDAVRCSTCAHRASQ
jgi:hypothetical protein